MQMMIDPDTALSLVIEYATVAGPVYVDVNDSLGLILAEDILSDSDYPPFDRSMMDGYAVRVGDAGKHVSIAGEIAAGNTTQLEVGTGLAIEIMTGAPCPSGTEAVVPKEDASRDGYFVSLPAHIAAGQNIAPRGYECTKGSKVLRTGDAVTPLALAAMVTFGLDRVMVYPKPNIALITTGDELVAPDETPGPSQIRNSNAPMLRAMARALGISPALEIHAKDTPASLRSALEESSEADFIVLTGAVSAGKYDGVPKALREFGATPIFHKVTQRPGKPILFATRGRQLIFGLPGNPLSCHLGFHRYVAPAIRKFMRHAAVPPGTVGKLAVPYAMKSPRTVFQLARVEFADGNWQVTPVIGKGSADMYAGATANAMVRFDPGAGTLPCGTAIQFDWLLGSA